MSELQAFVLCGGVGNRMLELTDRIPKCLLPVAGVPMFWYPLNTVVATGVKDVVLVFRQSVKERVEALFKTELFQFDGVKIKCVYTKNDNEDRGTADVIRDYVTNTEKDLLVVSGDFVSDASLLPLVDQFRAHKPTFSCFLSDNCVTGPKPGPKVRGSKGRDFIARSTDPNRLVFLSSEEDFETAVNGAHWMAKFPKVSLSSTLSDCHVYLIRHTALKMIIQDKNLASLKADFIPHLLETQMNGDSDINCMTYVVPRENGTVTAHANTIASYFEVNKAILKSLNRISLKLSPGQTVDYKSTKVSVVESRIDEEAKVNGGSVIKRSVVGENCFVDEKARIQNSLLMRGVRIGKGAVITNSILCPDVEVEENAEVNNCIVTNGHKIPANAKIQNEVVDSEEANDDWATEC